MTVRVGLVGAGPWAAMFHAPMLAAGPRTTLTGVWARRTEAAEELAAQHGTTAAVTFEGLLERCDAVAFCVPPDVQAELGTTAARAGRHLLLEKPLSFDLDDAERLAEAVGESGVASVVVLRNRFTAEGRRFLDGVRGSAPRGAQARFVTNAALEGSPFATPWRVERGALFDLGPHALDMVDAALGTVVDLRASGDPLRLVTISTEHEGGALGQVALSITAPDVDSTFRVQAWTEDGPVQFDGSVADDDADVMESITDKLADAVETGEDHELDVRRGLHVQRLIARVEECLAQ